MAKKVFNMQGGKHSAAALSAFINAAFAGKVASGFDVTETGSTGLNVLVQPGTGQIDTGQGFSRIIQTDAAETVSLSAASPSNPRRDLIVAYIDNSVTPTNTVTDNINNILKFAAVAGTPASTPVDPTGSAIQAAIGATNPYIILGRVRVAQSATSLTNGVIDDLRERAMITNSAQLSDDIVGPTHLKNNTIKLGRTDVKEKITWTTTEVTIASITVNVPDVPEEKRRDVVLEIFFPQLQSTVGTDRSAIKFKEGATILQRAYHGMKNPGQGATFRCVVDKPTKGEHTYVVTGARDVGTGTQEAYADATGSTIQLTAELD